MSKHINDLLSLKGKVALITGGAGWLGRSMTQALAEAGATVALADCNEQAVNDATQALQQQSLNVKPFVADAFDDKSLRSCIDDVAADCGRLDILINGPHGGPTPELDEVTYDDFDQGLHNGPSGYAAAAQQAVKHMRNVGGGNIINLGSMYGMVTGYPRVYKDICKPNSIVYQAGKAAIIHMTKYMAVYWAKDNIRVNCISPGPFPNETGQAVPGFKKRLEDNVPMGRIGQPDEMKGAVVFLASDAASYITGQNLAVDGGWTAW